MRDPIISQVLEIIGGSRPPFRGKCRQDPKLRQVWRLWHQLAIEGDVLFRHVRASPEEGGEWKTLVVIPTERVPEVMEQLHNSFGHMGLEKTIDKVRERTWWPGHTRDTEDWIAKCPVCARKRRPAPCIAQGSGSKHSCRQAGRDVGYGLFGSFITVRGLKSLPTGHG